MRTYLTFFNSFIKLFFFLITIFNIFYHSFGIILLKSLFSESMQTTSGEEVSSHEIKTILQECIDNEDKRHPLTDETLMNILNAKGYCIARRTVAKYREMLDIPVARLRKQI